MGRIMQQAIGLLTGGAEGAGDAPIVTFNRRDFRSGELRFPGIVVQTSGAWLKSRAPVNE